MTGQDAVNVSGTFNDKIGIDGVILTKLDGDTRAVQPSPFVQSPENLFYTLVWVRSSLIWSSFIRTAWLQEFLEWAISSL